MFFTDRQLKVLGYIHSYSETHGVAPTLKEIAAHFGVTKVTALEHVRALEKKQAIRRAKHQPRSIELVAGPPPRSGPTTRIPLSAELRPGPELIFVSRPDELDVASVLPTAKNGHAIRVVGNHLAASGFLDDDVLIIEPRATPAPGELVLVLGERGRATIGRFFDQPGPSIAVPGRDPESRVPIDISRVRGIVRAMIRVCSSADGSARASAERDSSDAGAHDSGGAPTSR